ncbi:RNA polymerase sigma factor [Sunxiuqinia sp. A32]|uniref:RNA polymerase sigma factor n=1 Tax=Sunxiuqinia sp. A32 TaxID=3461496 RepID=UPI004045FFD5
MDTYIWDKIKAGDKQAFRHYYDEYYSSLCFYANSVVDDIELAQDIVSDCFVRIWERKEKILIKTSFENYMLLTVRNQIYSYLRSPRSRRTGIDSIVDRLESIPIEEYDLEREETIQKVYNLIAELPEQRRKILQLAILNGLSYKDIAQELKISVNTVKTQMSRAYQFLRENLVNDNLLLWLFFRNRTIN